jgi:ribosome-associated translation inhibitor RaiA
MTDRLEVAYQGFEPSEANKEFVRLHIENLEKMFDRISSCSIFISAPDHHHRHGSSFRVNIRLRLPTGKEVDISKASGDDERHADFHYAVNDAFKRAKRQLHDEIEVLRGNVKSH